jgi:YVTN family beta-propeller protein
VHPFRSRVQAARNVLGPALRASRSAVTAVRGAGVRLALVTTCAAGCLFVATVATAGPAVGYTAYVADFSGHLTPINTATNTASSATAINDPFAVAITPNGATALVASWSEGTVTPVSLPSMAAGTPITVGTQPFAIAITPDGTKAYVANYNNNGPGTVTAITLATRATATIAVGKGPDWIAITPDGTKAYVANHFDGTVTPITIATNTVGAPITVGSGSDVAQTDALAVTPDGATVYAANYGSNSVVPITVATNTAGAAITGITSPLAIAITPDGATAYIAEDGNPGNVVPMTLPGHSLGTPIPVGRNPYDIQITPDQATAYVANYNNGGSGTVTPIHLPANTAAAAIPVGNGPAAIAITPDQAPAAAFTATPAPSGSPSTFDASASTVAYGAITDYHWNFGDGSTSDVPTPTTTHTYLSAGTFTATLTETDTAGTSTTQVFTGHTMSRNGGTSAQVTHSVAVNTTPRITTQPAGSTVTAPGQASFSVACAGSPLPAMQWQVSTDAGLTWTPVSGQTSAILTLVPTSLSQNGNQYRAACTNVAGSSTSAAATLTVNAVLTPPVLGVNFQAKPHGSVLVRTSPGGALVPLTGPENLPVGSFIDARAGTLTLVMALPAGRTQSVAVGRGGFAISQPGSRHGMTEIALSGGSFAACPARGGAHASAMKTHGKPVKPGHVVRTLWSKDNHGQFQTHGHDSVATVRGTEWVTQDRCDGTLTHVIHGIVSVRPRGSRHSITVTAGHSYLAATAR